MNIHEARVRVYQAMVDILVEACEPEDAKEEGTTPGRHGHHGRRGIRRPLNRSRSSQRRPSSTVGASVIDLLQGDCTEGIPTPHGLYDAAVTSPPYFGLRVYGDDDAEVGRGDLDEYINDLVQVGANIWDASHDHITWWLNLGDTASGSGGAGGDHNRKGSKSDIPKYKQGASGIAPQNWIGVPERVMFALQDSGWTVRSKITWDKKSLRPESAAHVRRPRVQSEMIYMLVKDPKAYRYFHEREDEPGDVWHMKPAQGARRHMAPFPEELPYRCIRLSTEPGDLVLDPFVGSGTTLQVAELLGRNSVGMDLYPTEVNMGDRTLEDIAKRSAAAPIS